MTAYIAVVWLLLALVYLAVRHVQLRRHNLWLHKERAYWMHPSNRKEAWRCKCGRYDLGTGSEMRDGRGMIHRSGDWCEPDVAVPL